MACFALTYEVLVLKPRSDECTLEVVGKTGFFELGKEMCNKSVCHMAKGVRRELEKKRTVIVVVNENENENEKKREKGLK